MALYLLPMHPIEERQRGYNQAAVFAEGLATGMQKPHIPQLLVRSVNAASQTHKSNFERMSVLDNMYAVGDAKLAQGKHILLVDDVMTTGATLEACATALLQVPDVRQYCNYCSRYLSFFVLNKIKNYSTVTDLAKLRG